MVVPDNPFPSVAVPVTPSHFNSVPRNEETPSGTLGALYQDDYSKVSRRPEVCGVLHLCHFFSAYLSFQYPPRTTPLEHKELFLHCFMQLVSNSTFIIDLYCNYDTGLYSGNLLELLISFLAKSSIPESGPFTLLHLYSLSILLTMLDQLSHRTSPDTVISPSQSELPDPAELVQRKDRKATIHDGVKLFNESPKKAIQFFEEKGLFTKSTFFSFLFILVEVPLLILSFSPTSRKMTCPPWLDSCG